MIEIQIVPSDIRRGVRYVFFDRRRVLVGVIALAVALVAVLASMTAAPTVIRRVYKDNTLRVLRVERDIQRQRLRENVAQMSSLEMSLEKHSLQVEKLITVYGLDRTLGAGGLSMPLHEAADAADSQLNDARHREQSLEHAMQRLQQQLNLLVQYEAANAEIVRHTPSILPLPADQFVPTSPFGNRINPFTRAPDFHKGLDLAAPVGTPIYATADGVVTFAGWYPLRLNPRWWRFGNLVVVNHADRFITIYGHCDSIRVKSGQTVKQGQNIAMVGSTGWSTNSHLHYEVRTDLEQPGTYMPIDPIIYILNYQWKNEGAALLRTRTSKDYNDFDPLPLPSALIGRRRRA